MFTSLILSVCLAWCGSDNLDVNTDGTQTAVTITYDANGNGTAK